MNVQHADWTIQWWDGFVQLNAWQGLMVALAITPFGLWAVRLVIQGILVNPFTHDWMSFNTDALLAVGVGAALELASRMPAGSGITSGTWWYVLNYGSIAFWVGFGALHMYQERKDVDSWHRRLGATSVYHFAIFVFFGPFMTVLFVNTAGAPWNTVEMVALHLVPLGAVVTWLLVGALYDPKHTLAPDGQSKHAYTSPHDGWRNLRLLFAWLRESTGLAADLKTLRFTNFVIDRWSIQGTLAMFIVTPGAFIVFNWVTRGEWVPLSYQWYSALVGDIAWALFVGLCLWLLNNTYYFDPVFNHRFVHYVWIAVFYGVAAWHVSSEWDSVGSWERRTGINYLWHNIVVYPVVGYVVVVLLWACIKARGPALYVSIPAFLATLGLWMCLGVYDGVHQLAPNGVSKHLYANPPDPWHNVVVVAKWVNDLVQHWF